MDREMLCTGTDGRSSSLGTYLGGLIYKIPKKKLTKRGEICYNKSQSDVSENSAQSEVVMNSVTISGKIIYDFEKRLTSNGSSVVNFTVGTRRPEKREIIDYHDCVAYDELADKISQKFRKDDYIEVNGYLTTHSRTNNGFFQKYTEIRVRNVGNGVEDYTDRAK